MVLYVDILPTTRQFTDEIPLARMHGGSWDPRLLTLGLFCYMKDTGSY